MNTLLVVDDEESVRYSFKRMFENEYRVLTAEDGCSAIGILDNSDHGIDVICVDIRMPGLSGIDVLKAIKGRMRNLPVIIMTAFSDSDTAIEAMKEGAFDYLTKPFEYDHLTEIIKRAISSARLQHEAFYGEMKPIRDAGDTIVGKSQLMLNVYKMIGQAAGSDVPVLISGESGVGKEIVARAIYNYSNRKGAPFMAVNCAALPEGIVEGELFGSEKGAFTGADKRRIGRFEQCDKGTIFLDEIGDMPLSTQGKLLRVLQDGSFERVGSNLTIRTDVRVIAASNKNLHEEVEQGRFREDLFHRLNVFSIHVSPLRERKEDIPLLSEYFISRSFRENDRKIKGISPEAMNILTSYSWPGNVRELENVIRRAVVVANSDVIDVHDINMNSDPYKKNLLELSGVINNLMDTAVAEKTTDGIFRCVVTKTERTLIEKALSITKGNQVHASDLLGITRVTLRKKMQEYNIPAV